MLTVASMKDESLAAVQEEHILGSTLSIRATKPGCQYRLAVPMLFSMAGTPTKLKKRRQNNVERTDASATALEYQFFRVREPVR